MEKSKRGGARKGAGAKFKGVETVTTSLRLDKKLKKVGKEKKRNISQDINHSLKQYYREIGVIEI